MLLGVAALCLPDLEAQSVPADRALIVVRLPATATLTIQSDPTQQTGPERTFLSTPLEPGKNYVYTLEATWNEGGQPRTIVRQLKVRAGQRSEVNFASTEARAPEPKPTVKVEEPKTLPKVEEPKVDVSKEAKPAGPRDRNFLFAYSATVTELPEGKKARIWLPVPSSSDDQEVKIVDIKELPDGFKINKEKTFGNQVLYVEAEPDKAGKVSLAITYRVTRDEVGSEEDTGEDVARFLQPDRMVPIEGKPLDLIKGKEVPKDQMAAAHLFYDLVNAHMKYDKKGTGWGRGDSVWAYENCYGNCTDFHSLFMSLARANKIPVKFEIGFPLPPKRGGGEIAGYHCWAKFKPEGKGWVPVDISEANKDPKKKDYYFGNLTEDRVTFSTGRDIELEPKQDGPPLNFFVYPYVEVDGKPYPGDKVKRKFTWKDLPEEQK